MTSNYAIGICVKYHKFCAVGQLGEKAGVEDGGMFVAAIGSSSRSAMLYSNITTS